MRHSTSSPMMYPCCFFSGYAPEIHFLFFRRIACYLGIYLLDASINHFRTAVPFWGQTTWNLTGLSPKWARGSKIGRNSRGDAKKQSMPSSVVLIVHSRGNLTPVWQVQRAYYRFNLTCPSSAGNIENLGNKKRGNTPAGGGGLEQRLPCCRSDFG